MYVTKTSYFLCNSNHDKKTYRWYDYRWITVNVDDAALV